MSTRTKLIHAVHRLSLGSALFVCASVLGCTSVPKSVKSLIDVEAKTAAAAKSAAGRLQGVVQSQATDFDAAFNQLDLSMQSVQTEEAKYAFVFSSNQNLDTKTRIDAAAAAYLIAKIYLTQQDGLSSEVKTQYATSKGALVELSKELEASWTHIARLQQQLKDYSERSAIANVDEEFAEALAGRIPGANDKLDEILAQSKKLKQALDQGATLHLDQLRGVGQVQTATGDLIQLLEKLAAARPKP